MPDITTLSAERRVRAGKGAAREIRRRGRVPGIIYGGEGDPMPISLEQYHPATDQPLHVDFMRVGVDTEVTVTVPVAFINHEMSIGLRRGGILNIVRHGVALVCQVDNIPEQLVADLNGLDIGDSVHISAVTLPAGSRLAITDRDFTIASIAASSAVREEAAAAASAPPPTAEPQPAPT